MCAHNLLQESCCSIDVEFRWTIIYAVLLLDHVAMSSADSIFGLLTPSGSTLLGRETYFPRDESRVIALWWFFVCFPPLSSGRSFSGWFWTVRVVLTVGERGFVLTQSVHEGRIYTVKLFCDKDYPDRPPSVRFHSRINMTCVNQDSGVVSYSPPCHLEAAVFRDVRCESFHSFFCLHHTLCSRCTLVAARIVRSQ